MAISKGLIEWIINNRNWKEIIFRFMEVVLGYPLYFFSFLMKRNRLKWAIGGKVGFADNSKYFYLYLTIHSVQEVEYCWIAATRKEALVLRKRGIKSYARWSWKGIWYCLTAGKYIFTSHLTDVNYWTSGGVQAVNLWHGVGIKCIEFRTRSGPEKKIYDEKNWIARLFLPHLFRRPDIFLSTSELMTSHIAGCFRISEQRCVQLGYPRCDIFHWTSEKLEAFVEKYENEESMTLLKKMKTFSMVYIYMPTFRDSQTDFFMASGIDLQKLEVVLKEKQALFLVKLHPATRMNLGYIMGLSHILFLDKRMDIYPLLPFTDVLITDYSSIYYDYLLMKKKAVVLFPFDYQDYIENSRDLAFDFDMYTPGLRVYSFEELLNLIQKGISCDFQKRTWVTEAFWGKQERNCAERLYSLLKMNIPT